MLTIKEYIKVSSLEQAYELNQKRTNRIIGGMLWMKMGKERINTAIDLSELGLDTIEETEDEFIIGCMVTLRQLERHDGLEKWSKGFIRESVKDIVGVQFRNLATVGGSLFGRFGFSDVLTAFLALDTEVELYHRGRVSLKEFADEKPDNDILVRVIVKKCKGRYIYLSHRNTRTDFPVLAIAVSSDENGIRVAAGARPMRAVVVTAESLYSLTEPCGQDKIGKYARELAKKIPVGNNMRGSAQYRSHLAEVLIRRGLLILNEEAISRERGCKDAD